MEQEEDYNHEFYSNRYESDCLRILTPKRAQPPPVSTEMVAIQDQIMIKIDYNNKMYF